MKLVVALMVAISCVVCVSPAAKADVPHVFTWTGEGKDNKWDTPQNWGTADAKALAEAELAALGAKKGKFEHNGHHYTLDKDKVYDIIGDTKKYNTPEAANYRRKAKEQKALKDQSAVLTKEMKAIYDAYPINHPNIEADSEKQTLKCLD